MDPNQADNEVAIQIPSSTDCSWRLNMTHPSGAHSSHLSPEYTDIPTCFLRRLAARCGLGDRNHGRGNRLQCYDPNPGASTPLVQHYDIDFMRDRYNHALDHLLQLKEEGTGADDHLGAVAWFLMFAIEAEEVYGVNWREVLRLRTPVDEAKFREDTHYGTKNV